MPFGEVLWEDGTSPTDYTYTGQHSLSDIGLMDYNARFYDPLLGRVTSPDSVIPDPGGAIGYNRFTYVNNNPMIYTDPSGYLIQKPGFTTPDLHLVQSWDKSNTSSGKSSDTNTIIATGEGAGKNGAKTADYNGELPLAPYYDLSNDDNPSVYGVDMYNYPAYYSLHPKYLTALDIYNEIINNPGNYVIVGHSAGGSASILAVNMLIDAGLIGDEEKSKKSGIVIGALVLLDPNYFYINPAMNTISFVNIGLFAESIAKNSDIPVILGDSWNDGDDFIDGAKEFDLEYAVDHFELANSPELFDDIFGYIY